MNVFLKGNGYDAIGRFDGRNILVLKGSQISKTLSENFACNKKVLSFRQDGAYVDQNGKVKKDIAFSSPSTAAQFVKGYSSNGWKSWRDKKGDFIEKYKEINNG